MKKTTKRILAILMTVAMVFTAAVPVFASGSQSFANAAATEAAPSITTTLVDGATVKGSTKTFDVWAYDTDGSKLSASSLNVTFNGSSLSSA